MPDDPSVLGNLPRSRPGRRSAKRDDAKPAAASPAKPRPAATKAGGTRPKPKRTASAKRRARARSVAKEPPPTQRPATPTDPVTGAIRLAGKVAGAGFKVAGEVLKRMPRP
jgi:hypothetical protein